MSKILNKICLGVVLYVMCNSGQIFATKIPNDSSDGDDTPIEIQQLQDHTQVVEDQPQVAEDQLQVVEDQIQVVNVQQDKYEEFCQFLEKYTREPLYQLFDQKGQIDKNKFPNVNGKTIETAITTFSYKLSDDKLKEMYNTLNAIKYTLRELLSKKKTRRC